MNKILRFFLLSFLVVLAGCGGDRRTPVYSVTGKVTDATGRPVAGANVYFHPLNATADTPKPRGTTDASGVFLLTTYDGNDGAPAGEYKVSLERWVTTNPDAGPVNQLPPRYADPDQSGFKATVSAGPNDLQPFQIKK